MKSKHYICRDGGSCLNRAGIFRALQTGDLTPFSQVRQEGREIFQPLHGTPAAKAFPVLTVFFEELASEIRMALFLFWSSGLLLCMLLVYAAMFIGCGIQAVSPGVLSGVLILLLVSGAVLWFTILIQYYHFWKLIPGKRLISPFWRSALALVPFPPWQIFWNFFVLIAPARRFARKMSRTGGILLRLTAWVNCLLPVAGILLAWILVLKGGGRNLFSPGIALTAACWIPLQLILYLTLFTVLSLRARNVAREYADRLRPFLPETPPVKVKKVYRKELRRQQTALYRNIIILVVLILVPPVCGYGLLWNMRARALEDTLAEMRSRGFAFSAAETDSLYGSPNAEEKRLSEAFLENTRLLQEAGKESGLSFTGSLESLTPEVRAEYHSFFEKQKDLLHAIEEILAGGTPLFFPVDHGNSSLLRGTAPEQFSALQLLTNLYAMRARSAFAEGRTEEAARFLHLLPRIRDLVKNDPTLLAQLLRSRLELQRIALLQELALFGQFASFPDADLKQWIGESLQAEQNLREKLPEALRTETAALHRMISSFADREDKPGKPWNAEEVACWLYTRSHKGLEDRVFLLNFMKRFQEIADLDYSSIRLPDVYAQCAQKRYLFSASFLPVYENIPEKYAEIYARERAMRIALGMELHRRKYGRLPESLSQLVPEFLPAVPADPFQGGEMRSFSRQFQAQEVFPAAGEEEKVFPPSASSNSSAAEKGGGKTRLGFGACSSGILPPEKNAADQEEPGDQKQKEEDTGRSRIIPFMIVQ